jgi:hypothetical protein
MGSSTFVAFMQVIVLTLLVFVVDISFNLRRQIKTLDMVWRKLDEIKNALQK